MSYEAKPTPNNLFSVHNLVEQYSPALPNIIGQDVILNVTEDWVKQEVERRVQLRLNEAMAAQVREITLLKAQHAERDAHDAERDALLVEKDVQIARLNGIINNQQAENELPVSQHHDIIGQIPIENENNQDLSPAGQGSGYDENNS